MKTALEAAGLCLMALVIGLVVSAIDPPEREYFGFSPGVNVGQR